MESISSAIFPDVIDGNYHGHQIVPIAFALVNAVMTVRSLIHYLKYDGGAQSIASMPLDKYPKAASDTIVLMFAYWGQSQLIISVIYWVVLLKYRSLLPFALLMFTAEWTMRLIYHLRNVAGKKLTEKKAPGGVLNFVFLGLGVILMMLSMT